MPEPRPIASSPPLPMTRGEMAARGWDALDVLIVSGDAYVDHPAFGAAMIGRVLEAAGWRVGVVAQPAWDHADALLAMGRPRLCCAVTAGNLDSMLAAYTAARHHRRRDDFSENGEPGKRPNHAAVVYAQLARRAFPGLPVILGGVEASLRRVAHYDYWEDKLRPSILAGSKANILVYGMGETAVCEIAERLAAADTAGRVADLDRIRGTARLCGGNASRAFLQEAGGETGGDCVYLPAWDALRADPALLLPLTRAVEAEQNPYCGRRLVQFHGARALIVEPPQPPLTTHQLDRLYALPFSRLPHPSYDGRIPAFEMIRASVTIVRGCPGGCSFCSLGMHQGRFLQSRSAASVLDELTRLGQAPAFRGTVTDLGGPTANLYGCVNGHVNACRQCRRPSCLYPEICPRFQIHDAADLLRRAAEVPGCKHVFVQSGIRMDVALQQTRYLRELVRHHVSGHLKVAPEHLHPDVLRRMRKPAAAVFHRFRDAFERHSKETGKEQYLVPYFITSFPGCTDEQMRAVTTFLREKNWQLQQVQDFIPLPMTPAAAMYVTGLDYRTGAPIPVSRSAGRRRRQQRAIPGHRGKPPPGSRS